ncbi:hypothetical protein A1OE_1224 [Candidatus Endolissoclinum faulkneri L2]|uniref:Uncharacterized protein n=1 Tax=Candidatus Endolissoclinum faulkneri L2 TaxID=1193729 RepID=K7YS83_9PROT|nr:hypothetical protein A1OE_1224 [Candidatus Endolissoclinum faulkneri L2]
MYSYFSVSFLVLSDSILVINTQVFSMITNGVQINLDIKNIQ